MDSDQQWIALAHAVSRLLGWSYFLCWGVSFYPQLIINFRRKSVTGLAPDYFTINVLGFACYTVSSLCFLFSEDIRQQYARRHPEAPEPTVRWNDLAFAVHALIISIITWSQFYCWGYERHPQQRLSASMALVIILCLCSIIFSCSVVDGKILEWIDVVYLLGWIKLFISLIKYLPQAFLNYKRQSTAGWSIENICLDFSGGLLSLLQLVIDSSLQGNWSGLIGNPVKFGLSQIAMGFDCVFLWQHYVLYAGGKEMEEESSEDGGLWRWARAGDVEVGERAERRGLLATREAAAATGCNE
ncbi:PQ loop repeat-domain-containing protein [Sphaerosporella brunnea]|uniref:PQ loop repeat-domain-containing protein n=1 Tax=Sphaerosporella brunnea TaxID=1250544 RepID=A0A5J5EKF3_9PEZI|nr:PQ loop repeat-domain-containing protein [Sphaerosporella brunnea]